MMKRFEIAAFLVIGMVGLGLGCSDDDESANSANSANSTNSANSSNSANSTNSANSANSANNANSGNPGFVVTFSNQSGGDPIESMEGSNIALVGLDMAMATITMSTISPNQVFRLAWDKAAEPLEAGIYEVEATLTAPLSGLDCATTMEAPASLEITSVDPVVGTFSGTLDCEEGTFTVDVDGDFTATP